MATPDEPSPTSSCGLNTHSRSPINNAITPAEPRPAFITTWFRYSQMDTFSSLQTSDNNTPASRTFGIAVPQATPTSPQGFTNTTLKTRLSTPATRNAIVGWAAFPIPIRIGNPTPRIGRNRKYESINI